MAVSLQGKFAIAKSLYRNAITAYIQALGIHHSKVVLTLCTLAEYYSRNGFLEDSDHIHHIANEIRKERRTEKAESKISKK